MKKQNLITILLLVLTISACKNHLRTNIISENESETSRYFEKIKGNNANAELTLFFSLMPKGGDLHHHYSGAIYAETYLDWASSNGYCINTDSFLLKKCSGSCRNCISIESLKKNTALYRSVLETWSDLNFSDHFHLQDQPDQHFFNTFSYFGSISGSNYRAGLAEIKNRAQTENVQYIETMLNSPDAKVVYRKTLIDSMVYFKGKDTINLFKTFDSLVKSIQATTKYNMTINNYIDSLYAYHANIDDTTFTMRFQTYASRNSSPDAVFTKLYSCFDAASRDKSSLLVGVNIVGPENGIVAMRDYWLHMQMFRYLKRRFATVRTSMHAGELAMGLVKPEDLTYHIRDAVFIANTSRIGHGIDIPYEKESPEILKQMKANKIPVEINLTSNEFILGIKGNDHPINIYFNAGIPIIISTDDAGVSRNNLTTEYVKLASRYHFTYKQIKSFVFNSIDYSFLKKVEKEKIRKSLENRFAAFEAKITALPSGK